MAQLREAARQSYDVKKVSCARHKFVIINLKLIRCWDYSNRSIAAECLAAISPLLLPAWRMNWGGREAASFVFRTPACISQFFIGHHATGRAQADTIKSWI
jgi:hypothetical protein